MDIKELVNSIKKNKSNEVLFCINIIEDELGYDYDLYHITDNQSGDEVSILTYKDYDVIVPSKLN